MESSAQVANPASAPALDPRRWWALALLCGAFFTVKTSLMEDRNAA
jgi:hypothetical protein